MLSYSPRGYCPIREGVFRDSVNTGIAMTSNAISPHELEELYEAGTTIDLVDVRTPAEFRELHLDFAENIPLDQLDPCDVMKSREGTDERPLYVICHAGGRGEKARDAFHRAGYDNVINVEGGTSACVQTALPLVRRKKAISLERQVRIAAGTLVLLGAVLGWFVHPGFIGLSAFVGAGLIFAGITDTCGMGMLLMKMPWNRCGS